jgi:chromosome segregation ATPase
MNSVTLPRYAGRMLAVIGCFVVASSFAAQSAPPPDNIAALKSELSLAKEKLEMVLRSYTLTTQENDKLKAEISQAAAARDEAVTEAAAAKARAKEIDAALDKANQEMAALRAVAAPRDAENARLREILRQTQDTNAALAAENARLKTMVGVAKPSPAGSYVPPASANP